MIVTAGYTSAWISPYRNKLDLINEYLVLVVSYHLYLFTDYMPNVVVRELVGKSLVVCTCLSVVANLLIPVNENV